MKISNLQIEEKRNKFINDYLKSSIIPTTSLINKVIDEEFKNIYLGTPLFKPFNIKKYSTSNSSKWNKNFSNLDIDLNLLYKSFTRLNEDVLNCEELYLNEKDLIFDKMNMITLMMENLNTHLKSSEDVYSHVQIFNDFYTCELDGDYSRNLPESNSFIDLINKNVKNNKKPSIESKINISTSTIELNTDRMKPKDSNGNIDSILNDEINEFYFVAYSISNKVKDTTDYIELKVTLPTPKIFNSVILECISPTRYSSTLLLSNDDITYKEVYTTQTNTYSEWMFESQEVSSFKIRISKSSIDTSNVTEEVYYYIFKNISCFNDTYYSESTYVSNPITLNSVVDDVTIVSNEVVLSGTNIDYFIGVDNGKDIIEWRQFNNNIEGSLNLFRKREKILNNSLSEYGESVGDNCYCIYNLPSGYSSNNLTLLYGYQMWNIETLRIPSTEDPLKYKPSISDYTDYYVVRKSLLDTEEYRFSIRNGRSHIFTQYVYCDKDYYVRDREIKKYGNSFDFNHTMYVNNIEVNCLDDKYSFTLKKGLNSIHVMLYVCDSEVSNFSEIQHNLNFKEYSFNVFAAKPMKQISNKDIRYNSLASNSKYFAIDNDKLIIKENMSMVNENIILPNSRTDINYKNHSRYLLKFRQLKPSKEHLVSLDTNTTTIRVMANLKSNNPSYSPQINSFRIISK